MPIYEFRCDKCEEVFDELCSYDDIGKIRCSKCKKKVSRLLSGEVHVKFTNPKDTSKWDNFGYRAGFNMDKAKEERRAAEKVAKSNPYKNWNLENDFKNNKNWGKPA